MRKIFLILVMLLLPVTAWTFDYSEMPEWGITDTVLKGKMAPAELLANQHGYLQYAVGTVYGAAMDATYYFTDDNCMGAAAFAVSITGLGVDAGMEIYAGMLEKLSALYGAPKYNFGPGEAGQFDPNMAHLVNRNAQWDISEANVNIYLELAENVANPQIYLNFVSRDYFEYF